MPDPRVNPATSLPAGSATVVATGTVPDLPPRWPAAVRTELVRRHRLILDRVQARGVGPVLDLSLPEQRQALREAVATGDPTALADQHGSYAAVVSVAGLCRLADLGSALGVVADLLVDDGVAWFVEPGFTPGLRATLTSSVGALLPPARGVHLARNVPATVRAVGLSITDVERFTMNTPLWPLRPFVELRAVKISGSGEGSP